MSTVAVKVEEDGIRIPLDTARDLGLAPGDLACLQLTVQSDAEPIQRAGVYYCWRKLGNALGVMMPVRQGDVWVSQLRMRDLPEPVGHLTYSEDGTVLPERSSSKQDVIEAINAARAKAAATR